ncbi:CU044_2847 family protein [Microlunatus ginsengisoli]|uniref:Trypsin-co-occurring domain-containing protein n=1 Tax=Microlunatus ginsengisoli TaxID=363863 RepID=A0ABP7AKN1_9ACTN
MSYLRFDVGADHTILVEVDANEIVSSGVEKAGLQNVVRGAAGAVAAAESSLEDAVAAGVERVATTFQTAVSRLSARPSEVEVTFGLKVTGEAGNIAIGKAGAEATFQVRMTWKGSGDSEQSSNSG